MGNKSHFFRQSSGGGSESDYEFNNNLIDSISGVDGSGTDITYINDSIAVFNGSTSFIEIPTSPINTFTDGVNDEAFRIELRCKVNDTNPDGDTWILLKKDAYYFDYQLFKYSNAIYITLRSSAGQMYKGCNLTPNTGGFLNITVTYDASKTLNGLNINIDGSDGTLQYFNNYTGMNNISQKLSIGRNLTTNSGYLDGEIDYLKIYKL